MKRTFPGWWAALDVSGRVFRVAASQESLLGTVTRENMVRCRVALEPGPRTRRARKTPRPVPAAVRAEVLRRDGHRCQWCGANELDGPLELHHVRKRSQGRDDCPTNLITLCRICHARTDCPYIKGRLVVMISMDGGFSLSIATKADKFAPDPVAP